MQFFINATEPLLAFKIHDSEPFMTKKIHDTKTQKNGTVSAVINFRCHGFWNQKIAKGIEKIPLEFFLRVTAMNFNDPPMFVMDFVRFDYTIIISLEQIFDIFTKSKIWMEI